MKNIEIKIDRVYEGKSQLYCSNTGQWCANIGDMRNTFDLINGLNRTADQVVTVLKFDEQGCYICLLSQIASGRNGDHLAAWIYVENDIVINGIKLKGIVGQVKKFLLSGTMDDKQILGNLTADTHQTRTTPMPFPPSSGEVSGYRRCTEMTNLTGILDKLYQPYYGKYKAIYLFDYDSGLSLKEGVDLSEKLLDTYFAVLPPTAPIDGFKCYLKDGKEFTTATIEKKNSQLSVTWKRDEYKDVPKTVMIDTDEFQFPTIETKDYRKIITTADFIVTDQKDINKAKPLSSFSVKIDDVLLKDKLEIAEADLQKVKIEVSSNRYDPFVGECDLTKLPVSISLKRSNNKYIFRFPLELPGKNYADIEYSSDTWTPANGVEGYEIVKSEKIKGVTQCTLSRIKTKRKNNQQSGSSSSSSRMILVIVFALLSIVIALGAGYLLRPRIEKFVTTLTAIDSTAKSDSVESSSDKSPNDQPPTGSTLLQAAVDYLDANTVWERPKMENIEKLTGLWDELNTFAVEKISANRVELTKSQKFKEIFDYAKKMNSKKICRDPKDTAITVSNCLDKYREQADRKEKTNNKKRE